MTLLTWGLLALGTVLVLVLICRTLAAEARTRAEVARIVRADLERLIEDDPIPDWPPGVERFFEIVERDHVRPIEVMPPVCRGML